MAFMNRLQHAWNAFIGRDPTGNYYGGGGSSYRPDRVRLTRGNERSVVTAIYNRLAIDAASVTIQHVNLDENGRFESVRDSDLNNCLTLEANVDQSGRQLRQDAILSMFDEGCVAIVPTHTDEDPNDRFGVKIEELRTGRITQWFPNSVRIDVYNELTGQRQEITMLKSAVAIVENPFYAVMNEPSSTLQRLMRKLNILDAIDEQSGSGKLDLIIQLPYVIKSEATRARAEQRKKDIEDQLAGSKFGIAFTDGTEKITQLNRSVENNLMGQIEYLMKLLFSQLGLTQEILDGTADEKAMNNYYSRTIEPILAALVDEMKRKFLTKTARSQHQSIVYFQDPFKLIPLTQLAELVDKLTRNEVMTPNEVRQVIGMKPSKDPKADELRNRNISEPSDAQHLNTDGKEIKETIVDNN